MTQEHKFAADFLDFAYASPTPFQAVRNIKAALLRKGFQQLDRATEWNIVRGGKYFTTKNDSSIIVFVVGTGDIEDTGFRIITAHTDSPGFRIKPNAEMDVNGYLKVNTEVYGGPILSTWIDRPLSIAGRVVLKSENPFKPEIKFVNFKKPLLLIPSLAIHLNRDINDGKSYNAQVDMIPFMRLTDREFDSSDYFASVLAEHLKVETHEVLSYDLAPYEYDRGTLMGEDEELISCSRIDNLAMIHTSIDALLNSEMPIATNVVACFDNEETGSHTKQGAASPFLKDVMRRITFGQEKYPEAFMRAKVNSFGISADMAHAVHPNFPEKHDPVNRPQINQGPVIKINANQKYTTDAESSAIFKMLCLKAGVPYQEYVNRSDVQGGSTLGNILSQHVDIRMVDVGNPMLAMHSVRELAGVKDHYAMKLVFDEFFK